MSKSQNLLNMFEEQPVAEAPDMRNPNGSVDAVGNHLEAVGEFGTQLAALVAKMGEYANKEGLTMEDMVGQVNEYAFEDGCEYVISPAGK